MRPPPPGFDSIRIGWPIASLIFCPTMRATTSTPPPGANGIRSRIGRLGYLACAAASSAPTARSRAQRSAHTMVLIGGNGLLPGAVSGHYTGTRGGGLNPRAAGDLIGANFRALSARRKDQDHGGPEDIRPHEG